MTKADFLALFLIDWGGVGQWIYNFQTLIAGLIAICAAYMTARPVWKQLNRMEVQTNTIFRDFLSDRLKALIVQRAWLVSKLDSFKDQADREMHEVRQLQKKLNVHWVFDCAQKASLLVTSLEKHQAETPTLVAAAISELISSLRLVEDTLDAVHRPASSDQHSEEHSYSDDEWVKIGQEALAAEDALDSKFNDFCKAIEHAFKAIDQEISGLRSRIELTEIVLL